MVKEKIETIFNFKLELLSPIELLYCEKIVELIINGIMPKLKKDIITCFGFEKDGAGHIKYKNNGTTDTTLEIFYKAFGESCKKEKFDWGIIAMPCDYKIKETDKYGLKYESKHLFEKEFDGKECFLLTAAEFDTCTTYNFILEYVYQDNELCFEKINIVYSRSSITSNLIILGYLESINTSFDKGEFKA